MKLGIIGSGMIVHDFLTTADQIKNMTITAISSTKRSEKIAQDLAQQYHIARTYTDNDELLADPWSWHSLCGCTQLSSLRSC